MQKVAIKDNFPSGFYEEFARFVVAFGRLEYLIKLCVKNLHAKGFSEGIVEAENKRQFSELCNKVKQQAGSTLSSSQADAFSDLINQAQALAEFRNDTVHASWTTDPHGEPLRIRPKLNAAKLVDWSRSTGVPVSDFQSKRHKIEHLYHALEAARQTWPLSPP